jgi:hypothetical protein
MVDLVTFLSFLYAAGPSGQRLPGYLTVWTRQDRNTAYFDTSSFPAATAYASDRAAAGYDVYFGTGLRRQILPADQRGGKADVLLLTSMWLDVDIKGPGHKEANLPATIDEAAAVIELCPLSPSVIVKTGGGLHAYWLLTEPLEVPLGQHEKTNSIFKTWQKRIINAAKSKWGYKIDSTANIDRVLRLPDTFNYKSEPKRPVEVVLDEDNRYEFRELLASTKVLEVRAGVGAAADAAIDLEDIKKRLRNLGNQENKELMAKVLDGQPFEPGERDTLLQRAASCVAFVVPDALVKTIDAAALAPLFEGSIKAMEEASDDPSNPPPTIENVIDKLSRALDDKARKLEKDKELLSLFNKGSTGQQQQSRSEPPKSEPPPEQSQFYTAEQVIQFANDEGVPPHLFVHRWIIQHDSSYYVYVNGHYKSPVGRESLLTHLKDDLAPADKVGVKLWTYTAKGDERSKNMQEVLKDYATGARGLKGSLYSQKSYFDAENETFWEAVCPVRNLEPVYDAQIDHWLHLLGGDEAEKLLDWIATVLRLDLQSSALYVSGEAGCLAGDTEIEINRAGKSFKLTIAELVRKQNGGKSIRANQKTLVGWDARIPTQVRGHSPTDNAIRLYPLAAAVASGVKETFLLRLEGGRSIRATTEHRFFTDCGWKSLGELVVGSRVYVDAGVIEQTSAARHRALRASEYDLDGYKQIGGMRHHPCVRRSFYPEHRLVIEADMNGLPLVEFVGRISLGRLEGLKFLPRSLFVHHINRNKADNSLSNLQVLTNSEHSKLHGQEGAWRRVVGSTKPVSVRSISRHGYEETYDLVMAGEPHNFIAGGMVVHNSGKTMLAHGLSRLWSTSGPTLLENVADTNFNADIARCPLIFGDEAVKCSTSELRRLVGSSSHTLKRKYLANVDLEGSLRIVMADNSGKLIHGEELGGADMGAVASKFLHITVTKEPVEYLRGLGGRTGTDGWVDKDMIAGHALWLAFNRKLTLGNRLAVEGSLSRMARLLVVQDRVTGILCEWIARYIDSPISSIAQVHGAQIGGGKILISAEAIAKFWTSYVNSERNVFSMTKIGRALNNISGSKEVVHFTSSGKIIRRRMHSIHPELIYAWAEENMSCDMDELKVKVQNGVKS